MLCAVVAIFSIYTLVAIGVDRSGPDAKVTRVKSVEAGDTLRLEDGSKAKFSGISFVGDNDLLIWTRNGVSRTRLGELSDEAFDLISNTMRITHSVRVEYTSVLPEAFVFADTFDINTGTTMDKDVFKPRGKGYVIFLNAYLVRLGYAVVDIESKDERYRGLMRKMEQRARREHLGVWE